MDAQVMFRLICEELFEQQWEGGESQAEYLDRLLQRAGRNGGVRGLLDAVHLHRRLLHLQLLVHRVNAITHTADLPPEIAAQFGLPRSEEDEEVQLAAALEASLAASRPAEHPIDPKDLANLPILYVTTTDIASADKQDCAVCLDSLKIGQWVVQLPCKHIFCKGCIHEWLSKQRTCPRCRHEVVNVPVPTYDGSCCGFAQLAKRPCAVTTDAQHTVLTNCAHLFHTSCIQKYAQVSSNGSAVVQCPLCGVESSLRGFAPSTAQSSVEPNPGGPYVRRRINEHRLASSMDAPTASSVLQSNRRRSTSSMSSSGDDTTSDDDRYTERDRSIAAIREKYQHQPVSRVLSTRAPDRDTPSYVTRRSHPTQPSTSSTSSTSTGATTTSSGRRPLPTRPGPTRSLGSSVTTVNPNEQLPPVASHPAPVIVPNARNLNRRR